MEHAEGTATGAFDPNQSSLWRRPAASAWTPGLRGSGLSGRIGRQGGDRLGQKSGLAAAIISLAIPGSLDQAGAIDLKARKDDARTVHILASCASDIMLSKVQFGLNVVNPDKIRRLFPGMEEMEIFYYRCQI